MRSAPFVHPSRSVATKGFDMRTTALIFLAVALGPAVLALYASNDQGLRDIMVWCFLVLLATAGLFTAASYARPGDA